MKRPLRYLAPVIAVVVLALLASALYVQKKVLPQQIRLVQTNLNVPSRYAFIADRTAAQLEVFDAYDNETLTILPLKARAEMLGISRVGGYLSYAEYGSKTLYFMDLADYSVREVSVSEGIRQLAVHSGGRWVVYAGKQTLYLLNTSNEATQAIPLAGECDLTFSADGSRLFIIEPQQGRIRELTLANGQVKTLVTAKSPISPLSIMPDNQAFFFNSNGHLYRYDLSSAQLTDSDLSTPNYRPYVSTDNRYLLVISHQEKQPVLLTLNPKTLAVQQRYPLPSVAPVADNPSVIVTGWLDQVAVVAGDNALHSIDLASAEVSSVPLFGKMIDMLVQSDSKTLLLDTNNTGVVKKPDFLLYDLRRQTLKSAMIMQAITPGRIVMGETNTLCH